LAAAQLRERSLEQIATDLHGAQTLERVILWSHSLLSESERTLLHRLSVFAGGWSPETAEQVCTDGIIELWEALDLLNSLTDKSLVLYEEESGQPRYRIHESIRPFALSNLIAQGEEPIFRARYARHLAEGRAT
jgi:predicted ATPase